MMPKLTVTKSLHEVSQLAVAGCVRQGEGYITLGDDQLHQLFLIC